MCFVLLIVHIVVCVLLVIVVVLNTGKGVDMTSALSGSSSAFFDNGSSMTVMNKITTVLAIMFIVTSLLMGYMQNKMKSSSIMDNVVVNESLESECILDEEI